MLGFFAPDLSIKKLKLEEEESLKKDESIEGEEMLPREINDSEAYDFEYLPKGQPLNVIDSASFKSHDEDFGEAVKKIYKRLRKNVVICVPEFDVVLVSKFVYD